MDAYLYFKTKDKERNKQQKLWIEEDHNTATQKYCPPTCIAIKRVRPPPKFETHGPDHLILHLFNVDIAWTLPLVTRLTGCNL